MQLFCLQLEAFCLQWSFLLTIDNFSFFAYTWSFFAYSFSFFTYSWSFFAYSGKVLPIRALRDCKQRSLTVSKKAPTVSKRAKAPFAFLVIGNVPICSDLFCGLTPEYCGKRPPEQWELWEGKPLKPYHFNRTSGAQKASSKYCQTSTERVVTEPLQPYFGFHWFWFVPIRTTLRAQRLKISRSPSGIETIKRDWKFPVRRPPNPKFLWGKSEGQDWDFQARLNFFNPWALREIREPLRPTLFASPLPHVLWHFMTAMHKNRISPFGSDFSPQTRHCKQSPQWRSVSPTIINA